MSQSIFASKIKDSIYKIKMALPYKWRNTFELIKNINSRSPEDYVILDKKKLTYAQDLLYTFNNSDFMKEPLFVESYKLGKETDKGLLLNSNDIHWRIHTLCWAAFHAKRLEGDFVDCGVSTGICPRAVVNYIDFNSLNKTYYLMDTFGGLSEKYSSKSEMVRNEILGYSKKVNAYEEVKKTFEGFNVKIIKGAIPETLEQVKTEKVCFLHVDMNAVIPEVAALEFFWDKVVSGGIIVLDDYAYRGCEEQKKAHDEFASSKGVKILTLPTCQGMIIKP